MSRYPSAEWVPWKYGPLPTFYRGMNRPEAVVLHVQQGWASTARSWASSGHFGASWHFTVGRDGHVMQHLDFEDGGYHAGILQVRPDGSLQPPPVWNLWKGWGRNVNHYTIGVEHEGFSGTPFPSAQMEASRELCRWLAGELGVPLAYDYFPPHAAIDLIDRANDFHPPAMRDAFYGYLFEEDFMAFLTEEQQKRLLLRLFAGSERDPMSDADKLALAIAELDKGGTAQSVFDTAASGVAVALRVEEKFNDHAAHPGVDATANKLKKHIDNHPSSGIGGLNYGDSVRLAPP